MSYTDIELIRKMLSDSPKEGFDDTIADGESSDFQLSHHHINSGERVYLDDSELTLGDSYTMNYDQGVVSLDSTPASGQTIEIRYTYSVFTDEELTNFLALDGSVNKVILRCIDVLLADNVRRFDYSAGQTQMQPSQVFEHLKDLREIYAKLTDGEGGDLANGNAIVSTRSNRYYENTVEESHDLTRSDDF